VRNINAVAIFLLIASAGALVSTAGQPVAAEQALSDGSPSIPACSIQAKLPGTYATFEVAGQVTGTTFTSTAATSHWDQAQWVSSGPVATAQPTGARIPSYVYYGTYALKDHKTRGCAYLSTRVGGKPYPTTKFNAAAEGTQNFATVVKEKTPFYTGRLKGSITGLSKNGGSGMLTLIAKNGLAFDTVTVTLTGRVRTP
jgi:hypothetical protein